MNRVKVESPIKKVSIKQKSFRCIKKKDFGDIVIHDNKSMILAEFLEQKKNTVIDLERNYLTMNLTKLNKPFHCDNPFVDVNTFLYMHRIEYEIGTTIYAHNLAIINVFKDYYPVVFTNKGKETICQLSKNKTFIRNTTEMEFKHPFIIEYKKLKEEDYEIVERLIDISVFEDLIVDSYFPKLLEVKANNLTVMIRDESCVEPLSNAKNIKQLHLARNKAEYNKLIERDTRELGINTFAYPDGNTIRVDENDELLVRMLFALKLDKQHFQIYDDEIQFRPKCGGKDRDLFIVPTTVLDRIGKKLVFNASFTNIGTSILNYQKYFKFKRVKFDAGSKSYNKLLDEIEVKNSKRLNIICSSMETLIKYKDREIIEYVGEGPSEPIIETIHFPHELKYNPRSKINNPLMFSCFKFAYLVIYYPQQLEKIVADKLKITPCEFDINVVLSNENIKSIFIDGAYFENIDKDVLENNSTLVEFNSKFPLYGDLDKIIEKKAKENLSNFVNTRFKRVKPIMMN